jgi:hypothetical protein
MRGDIVYHDHRLKRLGCVYGDSTSSGPSAVSLFGSGLRTQAPTGLVTALESWVIVAGPIGTHKRLSAEGGPASLTRLPCPLLLTASLSAPQIQFLSAPEIRLWLHSVPHLRRKQFSRRLRMPMFGYTAIVPLAQHPFPSRIGDARLLVWRLCERPELNIQALRGIRGAMARYNA